MILLHNHTPKSLLDSICEIKDMFEFCIKNKQTAIALTDHGNMHEYVNFYKEQINIKNNIVEKYFNNIDTLNKKEKKAIIKEVVGLLPKDKSIKEELKINNKLKIIQKKYPDLIELCVKNEIKPIIGCEVYETNNMTLKNDTKKNKQPRYHLILLAKNNNGLRNLFKIVSASYKIGFYTKPRIDLNYIEENNLGKDIICLTACQAGRLSRGLVDKKDMLPYFKKLQSLFDYVAVEIQSHDTESQANANKELIKFAEKNKFPFVVTTDTHMANKEDRDSHAIFVAIGEGREVGETYEGCYLQNETDIHSCLDKHLGKDVVNKAIQETEKINDMIEWVDVGLNNRNQMPKLDVPKQFKNNKDYLKHLVLEGFEKKCGGFYSEEERKKRLERIESELPVLYELDYTDYFIMLWMLAKESDKRKIPRGYSRGSGGNCYCLYCLNVTQIDSIRWNLDFSRFANLGRKSMADFDWDISKRRRKEMVDISEELFGKDKVAPICTFNTLSTKVAIRDIGKVLNDKKIYDLPYKVRDEVAKMIPTIKTLNDLGEEEEKELLLKEILFKNEKLEKCYNQYPLWFDYVMKLEGKPKSLGRHAAGTLITPKPIEDYCPLCLDNDGNPMVQLEMHNAMDDLKLIKMDYLGLKTLDVIDDCLKMANLTWEDVDINHLDLNDKTVYEKIYQQGLTTGIFQMESAEATRMCCEAKINDIEDVIAINAFNRPGTKNSFPIYLKNREDVNNIKLIHNDLKDILKQTYGVLLYQEQTLQIFRYAGFPETEVDNARRSIGKKIQEVMDKLYEDFKEKLLDKKWDLKQIDELWDFIKKQAEYSFNKGHSTAYGLLSFLTAYLSCYYPLEFLTACLISDTGNISKTSIIINECKKRGIKVSPPSVNYSNKNYTINKKKNEILFGILPIKGIGESTAEVIIQNQPYKSFNDFIERTKDGGKVKKDTIVSLIKSGAFPCKNKVNLFKKYFNILYPKKKYKPVKTISKSLMELEIEYGIVEKDKNLRLKLYNLAREKEFEKEQNEKRIKMRKSFQEKYMKEEYMWEFETLSMFLTNNPFEKVMNLIKPFGDVKDGQKAVVLCVLTDIKRKKDKKGNQYAYLDLYTPYGMIESICWASKYKEYQSYIEKGKCLSILGRKGEDKLFVESIKSFEEWKEDIQ